MEENKKPRIFIVLKIVAPILLLGGIVLIVLGAAVFREPFGHTTVPNFALLVPGVFMAFFSIPCFFVAFLTNINKTMIRTAKYIQQDNKEDLTHIADNSADIVKGAVTKTTRAVKEGLKDYKYCRYCGEKIEEDSHFCKHCGNKQ